MVKPLIGVSHIYAVCAILMLAFGALGLGTFPLLSFGALLLTALVVTASAWFFYCVLGFAVCYPIGIQRPGLVLPTVLGTITGAFGIMFTAWLLPANVTSSGFLAAVPFALLNTLGVWAAAFASGYLRENQTLWPIFKKA